MSIIVCYPIPVKEWPGLPVKEWPGRCVRREVRLEFYDGTSDWQEIVLRPRITDQVRERVWAGSRNGNWSGGQGEAARQIWDQVKAQVHEQLWDDLRNGA